MSIRRALGVGGWVEVAVVGGAVDDSASVVVPAKVVVMEARLGPAPAHLTSAQARLLAFVLASFDNSKQKKVPQYKMLAYNVVTPGV